MRLFSTFVLSLVCLSAATVTAQEAPGSPGLWPVPDAFNTVVDWNRTRTPTEPQQIHLSLASDAEYARVQFATLQDVNSSILKYWPKKQADKVVTIQGQDWDFVDGGAEHRSLYLHRITTKNLKPATVYCYQVGAVSQGNTTWSTVYEFHTASRRKEFSFLAIADIGIDNAVSYPHLVEAAKSHQYDFITVSGDQAYNVDDFNGLKGDEFMNMIEPVYARVPYMGVPGNHEAAYNFSHYKNRFNTVPYEESHFNNSMMYSFDYKSLHLVSFSTEVYFEGSDDQIRTAINWLDADLEHANKNRKQRPWIVLITHHPVYCSSSDDDCTTSADLIRNGPYASDNKTRWGGLEPLLLKHKVDVYLAGHVHNYERTYPIANGKVTSTSYHNAPSYMEVIVGDAGQPEGVSKFNTTGPFADWSVVRYDAGNGFSTVKVTPTSFTMVHREAKRDGTLGKIIDSFTLTKS